MPGCFSILLLADRLFQFLFQQVEFFARACQHFGLNVEFFAADHFQIGHYHSWAVEPQDLPANLILTARNEDGLIMGLRHRHYDVRGLQFHPESVLTPDGLQMMKNWIEA